MSAFRYWCPDGRGMAETAIDDKFATCPNMPLSQRARKGWESLMRLTPGSDRGNRYYFEQDSSAGGLMIALVPQGLVTTSLWTPVYYRWELVPGEMLASRDTSVSGFSEGYHACLRDLGMVPKEKP